MNTLPVSARLSSSLPAFEINVASAPSEIQWMPPGRHEITASQGGQPVTMTVEVNQQTATIMQQTLQDYLQKAAKGEGDAPYFDFNHNDEEASGRPTQFYWGGDDLKTGGVRAKVEWSKPGMEAVTGKAYRRFSPSFFAPSGIVIGAPVNMGGLVNRAAFKKIQALFASDASAFTQNSEHAFMVHAKAWANRENVSIEEAAGAVAARMPELYEAYHAGVTVGAVIKARAVSGTFTSAPDHEFAIKAREMQEEDGVSLIEAAEALAIANPDLYEAYHASVTPGYIIKARDGSQTVSPEAEQAVEHPFIKKVRAYSKAHGIDLTDATEAVTRLEPELYVTYFKSTYAAPH